MAAAFVLIADTQPVTGGIRLGLSILFSGADVPNGQDWGEASVTLTGGETPVQIRTALATAARGEATRIGYAIPANAVMLPSYEKG